ncbi:MAG: cysteine--tRNA ligase [Chloroflexia bacterium]|jgi:L-cysteine:1D-myo-inositol 2-amino-2-deoxy-alpha-D-glucopyranoside ligase|nr:cysteine--tRNA ligase [Chloroflexia bacterium]
MRLYNSESRGIENFTVRDGHVGMYVCGVTPYDTTHIGHAFTFLTFDILVRYFRHKGVDVTYVQNVTDIDDDVLRKAREVGMNWRELADQETRKFLQDMQELNAVPFDHYTAATDHIAEMHTITQRLLDEGLAYVVNGSVYFEVSKDAKFGKLSHLSLEEMLPIANERGNKPDDPNKRDPLDFVLWQAAAPGEPTWESPWGPGRPGWHIECTAMSTKYLGQSIDIHGGGGDLIFPHHECEIAQAENATGVKPFARFWMHVAMVNYDDEKMSKSLGNLVLAHDLLKTWSPDAIRLYLFSNHYRTEWQFLDEEMQRWSDAARALSVARYRQSGSASSDIEIEANRSAFVAAIEDDLDTPAAIHELSALGEAISTASPKADVSHAQAALAELGNILGLSFVAR